MSMQNDWLSRSADGERWRLVTMAFRLCVCRGRGGERVGVCLHTFCHLMDETGGETEGRGPGQEREKKEEKKGKCKSKPLAAAA